MTDLLAAALAQRNANRYVAFREVMPAVLRPQPLAYQLVVGQGERQTVTTVTDVQGAASRQQRASRFRFLEQQRAGKLTQPTATA